MDVIESRLATILSRNWWVMLLRGLIAIGFGVLTLVQPTISLAALVLVFGIYVMADGILEVWHGIAGRREYEDWWILLLGGLAGIGIGILTLVAPGVTTLVLMLYIAVWAVVRGILEIVMAIRLRREIAGEGWVILGGILSVAFGVLLMAQPGASAITLVWVIGVYAVIFGLIMVFLSFRARSFGKALS